MKKLNSKELDNLGIKRYVMKPNLAFVGGIVATKETKFEDKNVVNNEDEERGAKETITIEQSLENLVLTTKIKSSLSLPNYTEEDSKKIVQTLSAKDDAEVLLVYNERYGWGVPDSSICVVEDAIKNLEILKNKE